MAAPAWRLLPGGHAQGAVSAFDQHLTTQHWQKTAADVQVKLCPNDDDVYVLCRSGGRVHKEQAMRRRALKAMVRDLIKLKRSVAAGHLKDAKLIERRIAHLEERHRRLWHSLRSCDYEDGRIQWQSQRSKWQSAVNRDGAYLLRAHWPD